MKRTFTRRAVACFAALLLAVGLTPSAALAALAPAPPPGGFGGPGGSGGSASVAWSGATTITKATTQTGKTYKSTKASQNSLLVSTSGAVRLVNPTVTKSGGTSAGDSESFYGTNSGVMCKGGGTTTITGASVTTNAAGANGVFSYGGNASNSATKGDGTTVVIKDSKITTTGNGSGGIMTTGYGTTKATNLTVSTSGGSSAAIRSDRGGGIVSVSKGAYKTSGVGSPAIYATATVSVTGATLTSTASQGVVNEGGNTVVLKNCTLNAANKTLNSQDKFRNGVFLYQSMSGDASEGASVFKMTGGKFVNRFGHVFHVTNTSAAITLNNVNIDNRDSEGVFLSVCDDAWSGLPNKATVNAVNQVMTGDVLVGSDSTAVLNLSGATTWTGVTSGKIKAHKNSSTVSSRLGAVKVNLGSDALWVLTGDCAVSSLTGSGKINYNGHKLKVGSKTYSSANPASGFASTSRTNALPKVTGVSAASKAAGKATVTWSTAKATAAKAGGYQVWWKAAGATAKTAVVKGATVSSKVLSGLARGKKVAVKVRTFKAAGSGRHYGPWSASVTATVR